MVRIDSAASVIVSSTALVSAAVRGRERYRSSSATIPLSGVRSSCESSPVSCRSCRSTARMRSRRASDNSGRSARPTAGQGP